MLIAARNYLNWKRKSIDKWFAYELSERRDINHDPALLITAGPDFSAPSAKFGKKLVKISMVFADAGKLLF